MSTDKDPIIKVAIKRAGGLKLLGRAVGITAQGVHRWRRVPPHHVVAVEAATGIPREELRPDLYGAPRPRPRAKHRAERVAA